MNNKVIISVILLLGVTACSSDRQKAKTVEVIALTPDTTFTELNDSSFIPSRIMCMDAKGDDLYFSDYAGEIVILDKRLNLKKRIGSRGEGPGGFLGAAHFYVEGNDSILILNEGKHAFELFVKDEYVKHIPFPKETSLTHCTRFFFNDQLIFHSVVADGSPVVTFDNDSNIDQFLCSHTVMDKPDFKLHSARHLIKGDQCFFVIGCTLPVFQIYSFDGKLKAEYDLKIIPEIKQTVKRYENTPQVPAGYFVMIEDVYYTDQKIYLLVATNNDKYFCNKLCVLDLSKEIKHVHTFKLPGDVYESFCVTEKGVLMAFNASNASLDVFSLYLSNK